MFMSNKRLQYTARVSESSLSSDPATVTDPGGAMNI